MTKNKARIKLPKRAPKGTLPKIAFALLGSADSKSVRKIKYALYHEGASDENFSKKVLTAYLKEIEKYRRKKMSRPVIKRVKHIA